MKKRIVAEVTKNWTQGGGVEFKPLLSQEFEHIIEVNVGRGFELEDWHFCSQVYQGVLTETIIAVFVEAGP